MVSAVIPTSLVGLAGDDAGLASDDGRPALCFGCDEGDRSPIVLAAEVFAHGEPDEVTQVVFEFGGPGELGEVGQES